MICIVNVSNELKPYGLHQYEVRVNQETIVRFSHKREDDLAECLRRAADAVEADWLKHLETILRTGGNATYQPNPEDLL